MFGHTEVSWLSALAHTFLQKKYLQCTSLLHVFLSCCCPQRLHMLRGITLGYSRLCSQIQLGASCILARDLSPSVDEEVDAWLSERFAALPLAPFDGDLPRFWLEALRKSRRSPFFLFLAFFQLFLDPTFVPDCVWKLPFPLAGQFDGFLCPQQRSTLRSPCFNVSSNSLSCITCVLRDFY